MRGRNDPCWCKSGEKWKKCHFPDPGPQVQEEKNFDALKHEYYKKYRIRLKTKKEIAGIKAACKLTAEILEKTAKEAVAGVTTEYLNNFAHKLHVDAGAIPAPLHYGHPPFPKSICTSVNEVICHGIPDHIPLKEGDILNIDVSCILNGYYGDCSRMVIVGKTNPERQTVVDVSYECLMRSVGILKPGIYLSEIGKTIEEYAVQHGCSVVNQFVGHGVGLAFHEAPQIPHYKNSINIPLAPGMTFTIEPMINAGVREAVIDPYNQWTARTRDSRASAQWEHTVLITETGHEVLTPWVR